MNHQNLVYKIIDLISSLQIHVRARRDAGLFDIAYSIETFIAEVFKITEGLRLDNKNQIKVNFPAIDLADDSRGVAVQVTLRVTTAKWQETIAKFHESNLDKSYDDLRIIGFCESVHPRVLPKGVVVEGIGHLLTRIKSLPTNNLIELEHFLRQSFDYSQIFPIQDEHCFNIVFKVINRDALRHLGMSEGSYEDMALGLKEAREMMLVGALPKKNLFAKPLSRHSSEYIKLFESVDEQFSIILSEVNKSKRGSMFDLDDIARGRIDACKRQISDLINTFCQSKGWSQRISTR